MKFFRDLNRENQVTVLAKSIVELFALNLLTRYDADHRVINTSTHAFIDQLALEKFTSYDFAYQVFQLLHRLSCCRLSDTLKTLLCCITIFSPDREYNVNLNQSMSLIFCLSPTDEPHFNLYLSFDEGPGVIRHAFAAIPRTQFWPESPTFQPNAWAAPVAPGMQERSRTLKISLGFRIKSFHMKLHNRFIKMLTKLDLRTTLSAILHSLQCSLDPSNPFYRLVELLDQPDFSILQHLYANCTQAF